MEVKFQYFLEFHSDVYESYSLLYSVWLIYSWCSKIVTQTIMLLARCRWLITLIWLEIVRWTCIFICDPSNSQFFKNLNYCFQKNYRLRKTTFCSAVLDRLAGVTSFDQRMRVKFASYCTRKHIREILKTLSLFSPKSDQHSISRYNFNTLSSRQVMRV